MPEKETIARARQDQSEGKSPTTQAGEFVREEIHHIREGKHGARSAKQAIAIGLSKARRAGVPLPSRGKSRKLRGEEKVTHRPSKTRSRAISGVLRGESRKSASPQALSKQTQQVSRRRGPV